MKKKENVFLQTVIREGGSGGKHSQESIEKIGKSHQVK
jgi:hypothetical protein